ncbi:hypothetical protein NGM99_17120 [Mesorhizobium sp. RP14(2022)]|uniref:Uncharacterized protein n=1 Tax=Mesorhizobium liriopis TaxID=2953882 RepID=A0ABT1C9Z9_9HYPH|nr:hypothetical protein [Mesorhizobium liriopis]MCO6051508.1 hypothetical protein [Mesorhizobium liriopis]
MTVADIAAKIAAIESEPQATPWERQRVICLRRMWTIYLIAARTEASAWPAG